MHQNLMHLEQDVVLKCHNPNRSLYVHVCRSPVVCGVSSLGMDHMSILGDTLDKIAWNKAGIFKVQCNITYIYIWKYLGYV